MCPDCERLTGERDRARTIAVNLEQQNAHLMERLTLADHAALADAVWNGDD